VKFPSATLLLVYTTTQKVAKNMESRSVFVGLQPLAIRTMDLKPLGHRNVESGSIYVETNGLWNCDSLGKGNALPSLISHSNLPIFCFTIINEHDI